MNHWRLYLIYATILVAVGIGIVNHLRVVVAEYHSTSSVDHAAAYLKGVQ